MADKTKKELEWESLENRLAPVLVAAPAPSDPLPPSGGGGGIAPDPIVRIPQPKHPNPGWYRKTPV